MVCAKVNKIIAIMTASCLSPKEIAARAGVGVNTVYRMRRGYMVKMEYFGRVCKALGTDAGELIDYERMEKYQAGEVNGKP